MSKILRVSRSGLVPCPACATHLDFQPGLDHASCPFCGEDLSVALVEERGSLARRLAGSIGGALAAALGLSMTVACDLNEEPSAGPVITDAPAIEPMGIYGGPGMRENGSPPARLTVKTDLEPKVGARVNLFRVSAQGAREGEVRGARVVATRAGAVDVVFPDELVPRLMGQPGSSLGLELAGTQDEPTLVEAPMLEPMDVYGGPGMMQNDEPELAQPDTPPSSPVERQVPGPKAPKK